MSDFLINSGSGTSTTAGGGQLTVSESGAPVILTIEVSGLYDISLDGAQGGAEGGQTIGGFSPQPIAGGLGAGVNGDVFLTAGTQLELVVGAQGASAPHDVAGFGGGGGGGGGSFVFGLSGGVLDPIAVAGGGGGSGWGVSVAHLAGGGGVAGPTGGGGFGGGGSGGGGDQAGSGGGSEGGGGGGFIGGGGGGDYTSGTFIPLPAQGGSVSTTVLFAFHGGEVAGPSGSGGFGGGGGGGIDGGGGGGGGWGGGGGGGAFARTSGGYGHGSGGGGGGSYDGGLNAGAAETGATHSGDGQITITFESVAVCFATGTRVLTARGELAVENLAVGDLAVTASGHARPIKWIGHRRLESPSAKQMPVRVSAGAFGEGLPRRDLFLSPGHAVCVSVMDEAFVPVGQLINGATIAQVEVPEVTYWHVELESHDVLLAEGLLCESYMDAGNRAFFGRSYGRLEAIDPERTAESLPRYARPFVDGGAIVEAIRERLAARAEVLGWTRASDLDLHLTVDGDRVDPEVDGGLACFALPATTNDVRLVSRTFTPGADCRTLGTRIEGLTISDGLRSRREVPLTEIAGFHPEEAAAGCVWRWTNGDLALPASLWTGCKGLAILTLAFAPQAGHAWTRPERLRAAA